MSRLIVVTLCVVLAFSKRHTKRDKKYAELISGAVIYDQTNVSDSEGKGVAAGICAAMNKLGNFGLVAVVDELTRWYVIPTCVTGKRNIVTTTYTFRVVIRKGTSLSSSSVSFEATYSKAEMAKLMLSETAFSIPIGHVLHGEVLNGWIKGAFSTLFGTTTEDFEKKHYLLSGTLDGEMLAPEITVKHSSTKGYGMRAQTSPSANGNGFCSFIGTIQGKRTRINSLMRHMVHKGVELQACLDSCKTQLSPTSICLAATYDPTQKWCELAIRDPGMLHDQGTNIEVVANVQCMTTRQFIEMVKVARLVQLQELRETDHCEQCQCFVKDFEKVELLEPEPVIFISRDVSNLKDEIRQFMRISPVFSEASCSEMYEKKLELGSAAPRVDFGSFCDGVCNEAKRMKEKWGSGDIATAACEIMEAFGCMWFGSPPTRVADIGC